MRIQFLTFYVKRLFCSDKRFINELHRITKLYPRNEELYKLAFVHRSASLKMPDGTHINNERLEFLGDAVLGSVVAEYLYKNFPDKPEGFLSQTRSKIVNGESLAHLSSTLGLDKLIVSHVSHFDTNKNILGDAFEALIGAMYLDQGYQAVRKFIEKRLINKYIDFDTVLNTDNNYKSRLLEWAQQKKVELVFDTTPLASYPTLFMSKVEINGNEMATGRGSTKKDAEQEAARAALSVLNENSVL
ncbi:MAG: ribonuclease III [Salinivirgaceae bacterium]|nr:ribonuclease III [Salinivirgaceae bacterium]